MRDWEGPSSPLMSRFGPTLTLLGERDGWGAANRAAKAAWQLLAVSIPACVMTGGYSQDTGLPFGHHHEVKVTPDHVKAAATLESLEHRLHNPPADGTPNTFFDTDNELMRPTGFVSRARFCRPTHRNCCLFFSERTRQHRQPRGLRGVFTTAPKCLLPVICVE